MASLWLIPIKLFNSAYFNSQQPCIKFYFEIGNDNIAFLHVLIVRSLREPLTHGMYRKPPKCFKQSSSVPPPQKKRRSRILPKEKILFKISLPNTKAA